MTIYHYTDVNGLLGIINKKTLWATDIHYLNDSSEYLYGLEKYNQVIQNRPDKDDHILQTNGNDSTRYAICFSSEPNLLSQWRAYAEDGYGYCIGFDAKAVMSDVSKTTIYPRLESVRYGEEKISEYINSELDLIETRFGDLKNSTDEFARYQLDFFERLSYETEDDYETRKDLLHKGHYRYLNTDRDIRIREIKEGIIGFCKHPGFLEEFEIRILLNIYGTEILNYRKNNGILIPYFEVKIKSEIKDIVTDIYVGPNLNFELARNSLLGFLGSQNTYIDPEIIKPSGIPYRS
jgi:Protein of unknown function (DUF2971)